MKQFSFSLPFVGLALLVIMGCQKESLDQDPNESILNPILTREDQHSFITGMGVDEDTSTNITTLGPARVNPYTVENFTAAYNELYNPDILSLPITHYYIKFTPTTHEQLDLLAKSDLNIVEFPLDREIINLGDFYVEPGTTRGQILPLYAVVKTTQVIPQVPYNTLSNLHLGSTDETLIRRSLQRKGYDPDVIGYIIEPEDDGIGSGGGSGGNQLTTNSCGCQVYSDIRRAGGCIDVKDVEKIDFLPVRRVKVVVKDNFFDFHSTYTDDSGCWKINKRFFGNAYIWIHFASDSRVQIRGARANFANILEWVLTLRDGLGAIAGPFFNNIDVKYDIWQNQGSSAHLYWGLQQREMQFMSFTTFQLQMV